MLRKYDLRSRRGKCYLWSKAPERGRGRVQVTMTTATTERAVKVEWPTFGVLAVCYGLWAVVLFVMPLVSLPLAMLALVPLGTLHSSLTHEVIHGHPTPWRRLNATLVLPPLTLAVPYLRFRDQHLAHHHDEIITDPYDDPESNYLDPAVWAAKPGWARALLRVNNTLAGRIVIGPAVGLWGFWGGDIRAIRRGDRAALWGWLLHLPPLALVVWVIDLSPMPLWAYALSIYGSLGLLKIRTFLEHRAHEKARGRSVVVEDRGLLALLFLNNNYHVVHHMHPRTAWYDLPAQYKGRRDHYLGRNDGYRYASYAEVFRRHFWKAKDPVPHPLRPRP